MANSLSGGQTVVEVTGETGERLRKQYAMFTEGAIRILPSKLLFPKTALKFLVRYRNFEVRPDDICVNTFPKSGSTWTQEIVWNLLYNPNLDNPEATKTLELRSTSFDADMFIGSSCAIPLNKENETKNEIMEAVERQFGKKNFSDGIYLTYISNAKSPRQFKLHFPLSFFPQKVSETMKIVHVARDPRDVIVSLFHFMKLFVLYGFKGTFDQFVDDVINDEVVFSPYWTILKDGWDRRHQPNVLFIYYEDMKANTFREIKKIDLFLGTKRTDSQIQNVIKQTSFSQLKEMTKDDPPTSANYSYFDREYESKEGSFFRKGIVGDWKNKFTAEQTEKVNSWMAKHLPQFGEDFKIKI